MPETDITNTTVGDFNTSATDYQVDTEVTDGATNPNETEWINEHWSKYLGYYKNVPELTAAIDAKATWTVGKGFTSNPITEMALSVISGWGNDTFNTILENCVRTYHIGGDSFCEIIRDDNGQLVNLKPLDPGVIKIVVNNKGRIKRYEQIDNTSRKSLKKFQPEDIFHLSRNRVADEIHGESMIRAVEEIILMRNEAMADYRKLMHRNVYPVKVFKVDTDSTSEIATFKAQADLAFTQGENIFVPKDTVDIEVLGVAPNATLNPLPWIQQLNSYFFQACGVPQIVVGGSQEITEASAKISYLAWEQTVEEEQLYIEEQFLAQLNLEIDLTFPASLQQEALSSKAKEESTQAATPEDTSVTNVGLQGGGQ